LEKHKFNYDWNLNETTFTKDKGTVFSCFACGGGSTMGYKLAGFDVIGMNEIDKKIAELYIKNHKPKYSFIENIKKLKLRNDLPKELYNLDILDGSPPCFEAGTLIYTRNGYKKIEEIEIGDFVLTHTNDFNEVIDVMNKDTNEYFELKIQGSLTLNVTGEHPFYVRTMNIK
jgi:DNA (cytosine-5)-methyltransferase 1